MRFPKSRSKTRPPTIGKATGIAFDKIRLKIKPRNILLRSRNKYETRFLIFIFFCYVFYVFFFF